VNREQLQHVIFELNRRFGLELVYVVGSSAVFASLPTAAAEALTATRDVDIALPPDAPINADQIDFVIGEMSDFDEEYGYYAQGVGLETPSFAPAGWMTRTVELRVGGITALCMEIHDLALAKYGAARPKDLEFNRALVAMGALRRTVLEARSEAINATPDRKEAIAQRIARDFDALRG